MDPRKWQWPIMALVARPAATPASACGARLCSSRRYCSAWRSSPPRSCSRGARKAAERDVRRTARDSRSGIDSGPAGVRRRCCSPKAGKDPFVTRRSRRPRPVATVCSSASWWTMVVGIFVLRTKQNVLKLAEAHRVEISVFSPSPPYSFYHSAAWWHHLCSMRAFLIGLFFGVSSTRVTWRAGG